ncbi:GNAT family N-acetyltransferase [Rhodanobacter sp. Col0626]|uniref:GNAT family N-acetyltransferase n=1 Tax=Rhodanobacter sp. Col0626 TaxID=3415679 RepID=UPI003CF86491
MSTPDLLELTNGQLRLRPWQECDVEALVEAAQESTATVGRWLPWCHVNYGTDDAAAWITHCRAGWHSGEIHAFAVFEAASGQLLGGIGLNQLNLVHRSANLGYWLRQSRQGQGLAAAAATLVAQFGFDQLGLIRIEIITLPDNHASQRTAERAGARFEALARQRLWASGQAHDAHVYGLIPADLA